MEPLEFLGGKYNQPEQIVPGPVQTFKAQNSITRQPVYIHRVSTTEEQAQQSALLLLLATAMIRSAAAKRLVLDVVDEKGFWYVVTECEPQCLLLREWLQFEIDNAGSPGTTPKAPEAPKASTESAKLPDPGEFTRMFRRQPMRPSPPASAQAAAPAKADTPAAAPQAQPATPIADTPPQIREVGEFTRMFQAAGGVPPVNVDSPHVESPPVDAGGMKPARVEEPTNPPGEFTRMFHTAVPAPPQDSPAAAPPAMNAPPPQREAELQSGEFTKFFAGGLPPAPSKTATPPSGKPAERLSNPDIQQTQMRPVQRPNTPVPQSPLRPNSSQGEFTRLFSTSGGPPKQDQTPNRGNDFSFDSPQFRQAPDLSRPKPDMSDIFNSANEMPVQMQSNVKEPGEYTKIFGKGDGPPPQKPSTVAAAPQAPLVDDGLKFTRPLPTMGQPEPSPPSTGSGPGEFTLIMRGSSSPIASTSGAAEAAPSGGSPGMAIPAVNMKLTPPNLMGAGAMGAGAKAGPAGADVHSPLGSANVSGPHMPAPHMPSGALKMPPAQMPALPASGGNAIGNKKLYIFLIVLAVLAIALIVLVVLLVKK